MVSAGDNQKGVRSRRWRSCEWSKRENRQIGKRYVLQKGRDEVKSALLKGDWRGRKLNLAQAHWLLHPRVGPDSASAESAMHFGCDTPPHFLQAPATPWSTENLTSNGWQSTRRPRLDRERCADVARPKAPRWRTLASERSHAEREKGVCLACEQVVCTNLDRIINTVWLRVVLFFSSEVGCQTRRPATVIKHLIQLPLNAPASSAAF